MEYKYFFLDYRPTFKVILILRLGLNVKCWFRVTGNMSLFICLYCFYEVASGFHLLNLKHYLNLLIFHVHNQVLEICIFTEALCLE